MAYTGLNYTGADIGRMSIDFLGGAIYTLIGFAVLFGLIVLARWYKGKKIA